MHDYSVVVIEFVQSIVELSIGFFTIFAVARNGRFILFLASKQHW